MLPSTPGQTRRKQRRRVVFILLFTCHVVANLSKLIGLGRLTLCSVSGIFNWQNRKLQFSIILILSNDADSKKIKKQAPLDVDRPTVRATCAFACSLDRLVSPWADGGGGVIPDHCPYWHSFEVNWASLSLSTPPQPFLDESRVVQQLVRGCESKWGSERAAGGDKVKGLGVGMLLGEIFEGSNALCKQGLEVSTSGGSTVLVMHTLGRCTTHHYASRICHNYDEEGDHH